jgi:hypothetical protein
MSGREYILQRFRERSQLLERKQEELDYWSSLACGLREYRKMIAIKKYD